MEMIIDDILAIGIGILVYEIISVIKKRKSKIKELE